MSSNPLSAISRSAWMRRFLSPLRAVVVKLDSITEVRPLIGGTAEVVLNNGATLEVSAARQGVAGAPGRRFQLTRTTTRPSAGMTGNGPDGKWNSRLTRLDRREPREAIGARRTTVGSG